MDYKKIIKTFHNTYSDEAYYGSNTIRSSITLEGCKRRS